MKKLIAMIIKITIFCDYDYNSIMIAPLLLW